MHKLNLFVFAFTIHPFSHTRTTSKCTVHRKFHPIRAKCREKNFSRTNTNKNVQDVFPMLFFFNFVASLHPKTQRLFLFAQFFLRSVCCLHRFHRHMQRSVAHTAHKLQPLKIALRFLLFIPKIAFCILNFVCVCCSNRANFLVLQFANVLAICFDVSNIQIHRNGFYFALNKHDSLCMAQCNVCRSKSIA